MAKKSKPIITGAPYPPGYKPKEPIPPPDGCWDEVFIAMRTYVECGVCGGMMSVKGIHGFHRSEDGLRVVDCLGRTVAPFVQLKSQNTKGNGHE